MLFYLAFSFGIISKWLGVGLIVLFCLLSLLGIKFYDFDFPLNFFSSNYIWLFLMGMLSSILVELCKEFNLKISFILAVIGVLIYLLTALDIITGYNYLERIKTILNGLAFSLIVVAMVFYEKKGKVFLGNNFFQLLGASSYALYLIHFPLISVLCKLSLYFGLPKLGIWGALIAYIFIFSGCILSSIVFHLIIEKPMTKKLKKLMTKPNQKIHLTI